MEALIDYINEKEEEWIPYFRKERLKKDPSGSRTAAPTDRV